MDVRGKLWYYCPRPIKRRARYIVKLGMSMFLPPPRKGEAGLGILRAMRSILLVVLFVLIADAVAAYFGGTLLGNVFFLFRTGVRQSFVDLLFIEGIVALAIGGINIGGISESCGIRGTRATSDRARRVPEQRKKLQEERTSSGIRLLAIGAILIGVSLLVFFLPL